MERVKSKLGRANREHPAYHLHTIYQHLSPKLQPGVSHHPLLLPFQNILQIEVSDFFQHANLIMANPYFVVQLPNRV